MKAHSARALLLAAALVACGPAVHALERPTDRVVVRLKAGGDAAGKATSARMMLETPWDALAGEPLTALRVTGDGRLVLRLGRRVSAAEVGSLAARLARHPDVLEVLPDRVFVPSLVPNDAQYAAQWALQETYGVGAPAAWDLTTGSTATVVAILDTGKLEHPDLAGRWVGGHDFVGDTARSNDGSGRDGDATDPGDWVAANECGNGNLADSSRWHGLAMAGIIAATGNNAQGIAGLDWNAKLLPVRVVGKCGGYESDIADGMRWSVGIPVPGVPANPNPAKVLNVSLEAAGTCGTITQGAIDEVVSAGATVIASAGNNGTSVANYSPANCERVIAVGATNRLGRLPAYSNTGAQVTLSAPGGEGAGADAILTTFDSGTTSANLSGTYSAVNGTSASAAHVSGLVSLMLSQNPTLLPEQVRFTLQANAKPFPSDVLAGQANCNTSLCGAGIADGAVVRYAKAFGKGDTAPMVLAPSALNQAGYGAGLRSDGRVFSWGLRASERTDIANVRRIAASAGSFLALKNDGTVWDLSGTAAQVPGLDSILAIATGARYSPSAFGAALRANGTVFTWGYNGYGQLGDGTITPRATPASVPGLAGVTAIATGLGHILAVVDGEVWAWGWNEKGQLGIGNTSPATCNAPDIGPTPCAQSPVKVPGLANVVAVHAGFEQSFAVKSDGTLWAWGANDSGQLGDGTTAPRTTPVQVTGIADVATISTGGGHTFAIKSDGSLWSWGANGRGQLLTGTTSANVLVPTPVTILGPVSAVGAGFGYSFVILADGRTLAAGLSQGQLGIAADGCPSCFIASPSGVVIGNNYTLLFLDLFPPAFIPASGVGTFGVPYESNSILTAGIVPGSTITVTNGEYSIDDGPWTSAPGTIGNGQGVRVRVVTPGCGTTITATVTIAGAPHAFSVTTIDCDTTPDPLGSFDNQVSVAPGSTATSNAITVTGITSAVPIGVTGGEYSIGCSGTFTSAAGLVGPGQSVCVRLTTPATPDTYAEAVLTVASLTTTFRVVTDQAGFHTAPMIFTGASLNQTGSGYALRSDGRLFGFGLRAFALEGIPRMRSIAAAPGVVFGLRADGTVWQGAAPVAGLAGITALSAGGRYPGEHHVLALTGSGSLLAFGNNAYGQLGDGTTTSRAAPAAVPGLSNVTAIAAGMSHALAVVGGEVWAWGLNSSGQLGDGTTTDRSTPVKIAGLSNVVSVHAGWQQSFAIEGDGTLWAWGANDSGQLGDGTTTSRTSPVQVTGIADVAKVSTGGHHTFAIKADGSLFGWGANSIGQLLMSTTSTAKLVPTAVTSLGPVSAVSAGWQYSFAILADGRTLAAGVSASQLGIAADGCPSCYVAPPAGVVIGNNFTLLILDLFPTVFIPATDVGFGAPQESGEITAAGIAPNSPLTVSGGEYSIDGGPWTSAPGTISNGQRLRLRVLSGGCGTTTTVTVTIASVPRSFSASTVACDTDPQIDGDLGQPVNVTPASVVTSGPLVVNGINGSIPVSASPGAQYSVGCSVYTSTPGTVGPGQSVCLRITAPATEDTVAEASITIGPYTRTFRVATDQAGFHTAPMIFTGASLNQTGGGYALRSDGRLFGFGVRAFALEGIPRMRKIAAGPGLLLGLRADGTVWQGAAPVAGLAGITALSAGGRYPGETFGLALAGTGSLLAFGNNAYGQLGDGTTTSRAAPAAVPGLSNVTAIAAGAAHALAVVGGEVWAWGWNDQGQLGDGTTTDRSTPVKIAGLANVVSVHAGWRQSFAIKGDGTLWAWGLNDHGQLGDGTTTSRTTPVQVTGITDVATVSTGGRHTFAIKTDGSLRGWGVGSLLMGLASTALELVPVPVTSLGPVSAVSAGWEYSFAILADGRTLAAGLSASQLGIGADGCPNCYSFSPGGVVIGNNFTPLILDLFPTVFIPATDVGFGAPQESGEITAAGIAPNSPVTVTGGEYSIDGGPWTSAPGTISNGQRVRVQVLSAGCGTTRTVTVTIAGVPRSFSASTVACDTDPQIDGDLGQPVNVTPGSVVTSGALVVNGINGAIPVSASPGAQYSVGCSVYTSTPGLVGPGQSVCLRLTAPATEDTVAEASITIGPYTVPFRLFTAKPGFTTTPAVLAPSRFNQTGGGIGLSSDGRVYTWGLRAALRTDIAGVTKIAAADGLWLALRADGTVWNISGRAVPVPGLSNVTDLGAGARYSPASFGLARKSDGTVWAWGYNAFGQLGDGSTVDRAAPAAIAGLTNVTAIAAGMGHGLAVIGGEVWAWGWNDAGQLGVGGTSPASCSSADFTDVPCAKVPVKVPGLANVVSVHAGWRQSFAIKSDGTLWAWGHNDSAQLGDGGTTARSTPVQVTGIANVKSVSAGGNHTFAIKGDSSLWGWGANGMGQLLTGSTSATRLVPVPVPNLGAVRAVAAGWEYSFAIVSDGNIVAAGLSQSQLGIAADGCPSCFTASPSGVVQSGNAPLVLVVGDLQPDPFAFNAVFGAPLATTLVSNPITVSGLGSASPVIVEGGEYSVNGGAFTNMPGFVTNGDTVRVRVVSSGAYEAVTSSRLTIGGAVGFANTFFVYTRRDPSLPATIPAVSLGESHSAYLNAAGLVVAFGYNGNGQLGNGTTTGSSRPTPVPGVAGISAFSSGANHVLAARVDGTVLAWGFNASGQLGDGTTVTRLEATPVPGLAFVKQVAAGRHHSIALRADGSVLAWGLNSEGQAGDGTATTQRLSPVAVAGLASGITAIAAGGRHSLALRSDGTVLAWGANDSGQLGDGTTTLRRSPTLVAGLTGVVAIAAGGAHSLALKADGTLWAWGANGFGQLGLGDNASRNAPAPVTALGGNVGLVAAGESHTLAVKVGGQLFAWGNNANSQLGDAANLNRNLPYALPAPTQVVAIAGGGRHSAALDASRRLFVFGDNFFGQVGNRSGNYNPLSGSLNVLAGDTVISTGTGGTGSGVGTGSSAGSAVIDIDGGNGGYDFGSRAPGATATVLTTFQNASATGSITGIDVAVTGASFGVQDDQCTGATLGPGQSCTFALAFAPAAAVAYEGELVLGSNLVGSPERRSLYGVGVPATSPAVAFVRSGVDFAPATVGTSASAAYPVTNTGTSTLALGAIASPLADFSATHDCAAVAPGASCTITIVFRPAAATSRVAVLGVPSNAPGSPHAVTVTGTGVASEGTPGFALSVAKGGAGAGAVASSPAGIDCGAACSASFAAGTPVTLTATPAAGSYFTGWSGDCTGTGPCTVTMAAARAVTAHFTTQPDLVPRLVNISTRMQVLTGNNVLIGGFIIGGTQAKTVVVRARGPSLTAAGVPGALANPVLQLFAGPAQIAVNDNWKEAANQATLAGSGYAPSDDFESAILTTLAPGAYTAIVTGFGGSTGVSIIEVFELDLPQLPLANISTRGAVLTGANVMIGGFVIQGSAPQTVVVRARGPSLAEQGVPGVLSNPLLQLFAGAVQVAVNDNWQSAANAAEIQARGYAPSNALESAILITLNPGAYTAIVSGAGGATGVAIVEVFAQ